MSDRKIDPIENTPEFKRVIKEVEREADEILRKEGDSRNRMGYCHSFWPRVKKILKEKHNIDWKTPKEMNPQIVFD